MNEIKITGKVQTITKSYDPRYDWWNMDIWLKDVFLCDAAVYCYVSCSKEIPENINPGDEILVVGSACYTEWSEEEFPGNVQRNHFRVQVDEIIKVEK